MAANVVVSTLKNVTEYPNTFQRQGAFPLEKYSLFSSKSEAETYAKTNPLSYVGQVISIVEGGAVTVWKIANENGDLAKVDFELGEISKLSDTEEGYDNVGILALAKKIDELIDLLKSK